MKQFRPFEGPLSAGEMVRSPSGNLWRVTGVKWRSDLDRRQWVYEVVDPRNPGRINTFNRREMEKVR